jgi:hypothetical protein
MDDLLVGTKVRFYEPYRPSQARWGVVGVIIDMEERHTPLGHESWVRARFGAFITWLLICATRAGNSVNREAPSRGPVLRPRGPMRSNDRREENELDRRLARRRDRCRYPQIGKRSSRKGRASA